MNASPSPHQTDLTQQLMQSRHAIQGAPAMPDMPDALRQYVTQAITPMISPLAQVQPLTLVVLGFLGGVLFAKTKPWRYLASPLVRDVMRDTVRDAVLPTVVDYAASLLHKPVRKRE